MGPLDERLGILEEIDMAMGTNTYENTIFSGMNIPASLWGSLGTRVLTGFDPSPHEFWNQQGLSGLDPHEFWNQQGLSGLDTKYG